MSAENSKVEIRKSKFFAGRRITAVFTILLILCLAGSALALHRLDQWPGNAALDEALYIPSAAVLKRISVGYGGLLADIYWTRVVQYFGDKHQKRAKQYDSLAPLLDITTELDPHLLVAYQFGSIFLAQHPPDGAGQPEAAVALVEKGIRANPQDWQLYYNLGWIQYSELKDYAAAAQVFERGSRVPGAHPAMKLLAASMAQRGGDVQTARFLWQQIYQTTENKSLRENAIQRLRALQVDDEIAKLEQAVNTYRLANGRLPGNLAELPGWRGPIVDPLGYPYRLTADGRIEVQDPDQLPFITRGLPPGWKSPTFDPIMSK
jgi:tetratricopeptide (TPR) repeat protein